MILYCILLLVHVLTEGGISRVIPSSVAHHTMKYDKIPIQTTLPMNVTKNQFFQR